MRVLWITNIIFPYPASMLGINAPTGGGWMLSSAKSISESSSIDMAVATVYSGNKLLRYKNNRIQYYLLPLYGKTNTLYHKSTEKLWKQVSADFCPDIVHIHGTEFPHGLAFLRACPNIKTVISIQGLVSVISRFYYTGISVSEIISNITFRDIIRFDTIFRQKAKLVARGKIEIETIANASYIIGRTSWDKAHVLAINPKVNYYACNETLRSAFYNTIWNYDNCEKHSIFVSQAWYPIKGLHQLLKAMPIVLRQYKDAKIYVAGNDITRSSRITEKLRLSGYGKYIRSLIMKHKLYNKVIFTGVLDEQAMRDQYLKSNLFICPSAIENSPNSLGEAQLLGVPYIASYVGGIPDLICEQNMNSLYRYEEIEQLAVKICEKFKAGDAASNKGDMQGALNRHNPEANKQQLLTIYKNIISSSSKI